MRVALDASFLAMPPSGVGAYVSSLVEAMAALPGIDLVILDPGWVRSGWDSHEHGLPVTALRQKRQLLGRAIAWRRRPRRFAWELLEVAAAARAARVDLLHVPHFSAPLTAPAPLVVTIHDLIPLTMPSYRASVAMRLYLPIIQARVRFARMILTPSAAAAADIVRLLGIPRERIRVTPIAPHAHFAPGQDLVAAAAVARRAGVAGRYIFNVGGLDVRKNLPVLVEAFARLLPQLKEPLSLVIAGAPHSANQNVFQPLAPIIEQHGLTGRVILTGWVSEQDKLALYQAAALYVTPSLAEGFGLTAVEAMACGVPTIASNRGSFPEVVAGGGLLVEPEPAALAAAMLAVLSDPARAATMRADGIARAASFSWGRTARLTLDAYEEALSAPR